MTDTSILYAGILCFSLTLVGFVLTIAEFRRMSQQVRANIPNQPASTDRGLKRTFQASSAATAHPHIA